jgi:hypothetical protein
MAIQAELAKLGGYKGQRRIEEGSKKDRRRTKERSKNTHWMTAGKATHIKNFPVRHRYAVNLERRPGARSIKKPPAKSWSNI